MLRIFVEIVTAVFAVFGFYSFWGLVARRLFGSENIILSIVILDQADLETVEESVREAIYGALSMKCARVAILVSEEFWSDPRIAEVATKYGADRYIVSKTE